MRNDYRLVYEVIVPKEKVLEIGSQDIIQEMNSRHTGGKIPLKDKVVFPKTKSGTELEWNYINCYFKGSVQLRDGSLSIRYAVNFVAYSDIDAEIIGRRIATSVQSLYNQNYNFYVEYVEWKVLEAFRDSKKKSRLRDTYDWSKKNNIKVVKGSAFQEKESNKIKDKIFEDDEQL